MKLLSLELENYQRIKKEKINFDGQSMAISGRNESGKTTVANAYMWLLTGKSYTNEPKYSPQTVSGDKLAHHLDHSVTAVFESEEGKRFSLKKTYREVWRKKRGSETEELVGGENLFEIDKVPTKASDFDAFVTDNFGDQEIIQILTKPEYFSETIGWQDRREIVMSLIEDVSDQDVIDSRTDLADLAGYLLKHGAGSDRYTLDELEQIARAEKKKAGQKIDEIPSRIDEVTRLMPDKLSKKEISAAAEKLAEEEKSIEMLTAELAAIRATPISSSIALQIAELEEQMAIKRADYLDKNNQIKERTSDLIMMAKKRNAQFDEEVEHNGRQLLKLERELGSLEEMLEIYRKSASREFESFWAEDLTCPVCEQDLPEDRIEESKKAFNLRKSQTLEEWKSKIYETEESVKSLEKQIENALKLKPTAEEEKRRQQSEGYIKQLEAELKELRAYDPSEEDEIQALAGEVALLKAASADDEKEKRKEQIAEYESMISDQREKADEVRAILRQADERSKHEDRIVELEDELSEYAGVFELAERKLYLIQQFVMAKADMLTGKINAFFNDERLQFKLFNVLKNGGIEPTCEVLVVSDKGDLVEYKAANRAGRINAGLEIIKVLGSKRESLPVLIDNAESVNTLNDIGIGQVIAFYVTQNKELKFEAL